MSIPKSIAFHTLGCKLNYSETSSIQRQFEEHGYLISPFDQSADIYVVNTCSVTDFADKKCRAAVRKAKKLSPDSKIVMIGCYAQLKPEEIAKIPDVDMVLGAKEKFNLIHHINEISVLNNSCTIKASEIGEVDEFKDAYSFGGRTRSFLKVQDGCNYKCSFCTIPLARGKSRSDQLENVVRNAKKISALGVQEIVLTGVNIGDYEDESSGQKRNFIDLIKALDTVADISRFRISSIEPNLCSDDVIEFVAASNQFVPHFHMPLQSGSEKILSMMRRRYKRDLYRDRVSKIKSLMPHCCIGVDVIVGFPGETDEDFLDTYHFIKDLDISYLHVFTYSERANTVAPDMAEAVPMNIRKERNQMLRILSEKKKRAFYDMYSNTPSRVLVEKAKQDSFLTGFTDNYIKVKLPNTLELNTLIHVDLQEVDEKDGLMVAK